MLLATCSAECVPRGKGARRETRADRERHKARGQQRQGQEETRATEERDRVQGLSCLVPHAAGMAEGRETGGERRRAEE